MCACKMLAMAGVVRLVGWRWGGADKVEAPTKVTRGTAPKTLRIHKGMCSALLPDIHTNKRAPHAIKINSGLLPTSSPPTGINVRRQRLRRPRVLTRRSTPTLTPHTPPPRTHRRQRQSRSIPIRNLPCCPDVTGANETGRRATAAASSSSA